MVAQFGSPQGRGVKSSKRSCSCRLLDGGEEDVGGVEALLGVRRLIASAQELRLEGDAVDVRIIEAEADRLPEVRQVVVRHRHRQRGGNVRRGEIGERLFLHLAQVSSTQRLVAGFLQAVELQIDLQAAAAEDLAEFLAECGLFGEADAVGVDQQEVDLRMLLGPAAEIGSCGCSVGSPPESCNISILPLRAMTSSTRA
jgi:hypothetical protein